MQRLFTSFPSGAPGAALLLLRLLLGARLCIDGWSMVFGAPLISVGGVTLLVLGGMTLSGVFTPVVQGSVAGFSAISCGVQLAIGARILGDATAWQAAFVAAIATALALLGPGAYSIDASWYGRRLIKVSINAVDRTG